MGTKKLWIIGIDEAGRGPLAGPVSLGVVAIEKKRLISWGKVNDSKKQTEIKREAIFKAINKAKKNKELLFAHAFGSEVLIDKEGITHAIAFAMACALKKIKIDPENTKILLDGSLKAPKIYKNQKTIIKGDEKETVIALASIVAKVRRDKYMIHLAKKYPKYGFEIHKGYGTKKHCEAIHKFGLSKVHRKSFCKKYQKS